MTIHQPLRVCAKCGMTKSVLEFGRQSESAIRKRTIVRQCRACVQERQRGWIEENRKRLALDGVDLTRPVICSRCKEEKKAFEFALAKSKKSGLSAQCRECLRETDRIRYSEHTVKRKAQAKWGMIKSKFGLTRERWIALLDEQDGRCAICADEIHTVPEGRTDKRAACVDHDHETKEVRGLLCARCNQGIGLLRDDSAIAEKAALYLRKYGK